MLLVFLVNGKKDTWVGTGVVGLHNYVKRRAQLTFQS